MKMRGSQDQLLLNGSPATSSTLSSTYDLLHTDKQPAQTADARRNAGYDNMFSEYSPMDKPVAVNNFHRRRSVQSTNSLNRNFSKFHRRGSIPCLSLSAQSSPVMSPKKSHTAPNPFPELINSPPQTPNVDHRRSRSSNVDDRSWLSPEELENGEVPDNECTATATTQSHTNGSYMYTGPAAEAGPTPHATSPSSQQAFPVYSPTKLRAFPAGNTESDTFKGLPRNSSFEQKYGYGYSQYNGMDYTSRHSDRVSPTHSTGRQSPESESVIYDHASALVTPNGYTKQMLKVYTDEKNSKTVKIDEKMKACEVCHMIVRDSGHQANKNWSIVEVLPKFDLERSLEDHETVYSIYRSWSNTENNRFRFTKDSTKYEMFQNASKAFPAHMLDPVEGTNSPKHSPKTKPKTQQREAAILLRNLVEDMEKLPDVQSYLHIKESGKKQWKKHFCVLRKSGLFYSSKGTSKDPRHLVLLAELNYLNIYTANNAKKRLGAPNNNCFCLKAAYCVSDVKELRLFCAEDEPSKISWVEALRLVKYGAKLRESFHQAVRHEIKLQSIENREGVHRTYGKLNPTIKSRVAMDFTGGSCGRVVDDPNEALGVALEEAQHWRKKQVRIEQHIKPEEYRLHLTQPWFHCGITREQAVHAIHQQGMCDGVFLVRESQSLLGSYVLSMAHGGKVKHCTIKAFDYGGEIYYSMDGGQTKFLDLIQLVEFYQINANGLPCRLADYVETL